ncbi:hypothetical protein [Pandoraea cepalis]|uniref:Uncharacterized protein n=1 Tax=Pandoraea cepalis TaxID=2508294 RepID=A0A5E4VX10_9BURK|nr:hypothetical protein [Pandoraea cepalis]VVE15824.1 hypothetical protein PCE31107_02885 [Pandoraea cepalis]
MEAPQRKCVLDVSIVEKFDSAGSISVEVAHVKDALGDDRTPMFRAFAEREGFDLSKRAEVEQAVGKFCEKFVSILP